MLFVGFFYYNKAAVDSFVNESFHTCNTYPFLPIAQANVPEFALRPLELAYC